MDTWVWIVIVAAAVLVLLAILWVVSSRRRTTRLREGFGPEYERAVEQSDSRRDAERELEERRERREQLDIRPLSPASRDRYLTAWERAQARFVDDPAGAIGEADQLIAQVMGERGYPVGDDFERRAADVSVDHPHVVENYRAGHAISDANERGEASTEDLRQAMVHYRSLFEELLETRGAEPVEAQR